MTIDTYVTKHEEQLKRQLAGKKYLENVTDENAKLAADRLHIDNVMADTNYLHGDGLLPVVDSSGTRIDTNGKVIAYLDMTVKVQDYIALIDGYMLGDKNLSASTYDLITLAAADATNPRVDIICLKPYTDSSGNKQHAKGEVYKVTGTPAAAPTIPTIPTGSILLASINVAAGATAISTANIIDERDWLWDVDALYADLQGKIINTATQLGAQVAASNYKALLNISTLGFRINAQQAASAQSMYNGFVEVFADDTGIDDAASSDYMVTVDQKAAPLFTFDAATSGIWHFNETEGSILKEASGAGRDGVLYKGARVAGKFGNGIEYPSSVLDTGGKVFVQVPDYAGLDFTNADKMSFSFWLYRKDRVGWQTTLFKGVQAESFNYLIGFWYGTDNIKFTWNFNYSWGWRDVVLWDWNWPLNEWHMMTIVVDAPNDNFKFYIDDGTLVYNYDWPGVFAGAPLLTNNYALGTTDLQTLSAIQDELRIYKKALNQSEIATLYAGTELGTEASQGIVVTNAYDASVAPNSALLVAEADAGVTFEVSRDDGTTWTAATSGTPANISGQPSGTKMRVKATIPSGKKLDNVALWW